MCNNEDCDNQGEQIELDDVRQFVAGWSEFLRDLDELLVAEAAEKKG